MLPCICCGAAARPPQCQLACLAVPQWLFLLVTCCKEESWQTFLRIENVSKRKFSSSSESKNSRELRISEFFKNPTSFSRIKDNLNSNQELRIKNNQLFAINLKYFPNYVLSGSVAQLFLGCANRPPRCPVASADGTGHLSTKITCNVENLSTLCGAPKRLIKVESGILFFRIFSCGPNFLSPDHRRWIYFQGIFGIEESSWHWNISCFEVWTC